MSAKSRSRRHIKLPLKRDDYIDDMKTIIEGGETFVLVHTRHDRLFVMSRVKGYKRPYKIHELTRP